MQMCYRRVCHSTAGDWGSNNPVLALSFRRCRTTAYTSSAVSRFTNMLLSPRPFGSRSVVRLGVISPELRPPLAAIPSVRDTAHFLLAYSYAGQSPDVKQQIVDMAMNASGIRDTARVLHVSPTTVLKELKKRHLNSSK